MKHPILLEETCNVVIASEPLTVNGKTYAAHHPIPVSEIEADGGWSCYNSMFVARCVFIWGYIKYLWRKVLI
jgi:hypothetical protein